MLATLFQNHPLLNGFLMMLWFFLFVFWIYILITVILDVFRSRDLGGGAKALWFLFIVFLPVLGVLVYLIARGRSMAERAAERVEASQKQMDEYVRSTAGGVSVPDQLSKLADLKDRGVITEAEYEAQKAKLLAA